jgi:DNA polymerase
MTLKEEILELKRKCYECQECPLGRKLVDGLDPHVFASGYIKAKLIFVAEAGGADEVKLKRPLVGRAGQFFDGKILGVAGIDRSKVFISNSVLCRPSGNRTPLPAEIELCRPHLDAQICLLEPELLITMGNVALQSCCEERGITKKRGILRWSRKWSNDKRVPVFPIYHPAYCLRGSGLGEMKQDAEKIGEFYRRIQSGAGIIVEEYYV